MSPLNPQDFPSREEFSRQVEITFARANAIKEIIDLLDQNSLETRISKISKQLEAPSKDFHIGGAHV